MSQIQLGIVYGVAANLAWGLMPLFWKQLVHISPAEVVAQRVLWSLVFVLCLLAVQRRLPALAVLLRDRRRLAWLLGSAALISFNWGLYVWAVGAERLTEASLGYYINPLVNVLLGRLFLGERLSPTQLISVLIAAAGVLNLTWGATHFPWLALSLAGTFGLYGLLRKQAPVEPLPGLGMETLLAAPAALILMGLHLRDGGSAFQISTPPQILLVVSAGALTALPLLWYAHAARRLKYSTLGILQYLAPSLQLALAVGLYGEPFTSTHALTFALIWAAVGLYAWESMRRRPLEAAPAQG